MFPWKQRLYAFLLRRILGPYLSESSLLKLHESIEVSLQEGKFALKDLELREEVLSRVLNEKSPDAALRVIKAKVRTLQIHLWLSEDGEDPVTSKEQQAAPKSSLAWRAMNLGVQEGIALTAHIEVAGLELWLEPSTPSEQPLLSLEHTNMSPKDETPTSPPSTATTSMVSGYVDAALASLRLSLHVKNTKVRLCTSVHTETKSRQWFEFGLGEMRYHDVSQPPTRSTSKPTAKSRVALHKAIDVSGLVLQVGEDRFVETDNAENGGRTFATTIAKTDGKGGQIVFRAIETDSGSEDAASPPLQQDVEIKLNQKLNVLVGDVSLKRLLAVATEMLNRKHSAPASRKTTSPPISNGSYQSTTTTALLEASLGEDYKHQQSSQKTDEEDLSIINGIMEQYKEARRSAETNEVRGGFLLPSIDVGGMVSFDAFFDANDHSFYNYASMMAESNTRVSVIGEETNHVHTQVSFYLRELQVKVNFPSCHGRPSYSQEYALMTLADINSSSSISGQETTSTSSISHVLVEVSQIVEGSHEISTLLSFADRPTEEVIALAPCISLDVTTKKAQSSSQNTTNLDLRLEPVEFFGYPTTLRKFSALVGAVKPAQSATNENARSRTTSNASEATTSDDESGSFEFLVSCNSLRIMVPLALSECGDSTEAMNTLFARTAYTISNESTTGTAYLGIGLDDIAISTVEQTVARVVEKEPKSVDLEKQDGQLLSCRGAVIFLTFPRKDEQDRILRTDRIDVVAIMGATPISICRRIGSVGGEAVGKRHFPSVPSISSFKARQEDDDEEDDLGASFAGIHDEDDEGNGELTMKTYDAQPAMLMEAEQCHELLDIVIPDVSIDLTKDELHSLSLVSQCLVTNDLEGEDMTDEDEEKATGAPPVILISEEAVPRRAVCVELSQVNLFLHQVTRENCPFEQKDEVFSIAIIGDRWRVYALSHGPRRLLRFAVQSVDLYDVDDLINATPHRMELAISTSVEDCCDRLHNRMHRLPATVAHPIIHVSQLYPALSPNCPVLLLDVLELSSEAERTVHFAAYNMTYRYNVDSEWIDRLLSFCRFGDQTTTTNEMETTSQVEQEPSLMKLFVTLADCSVDYTSSLSFEQASRSILRVSEVRLSSNVLSPPGPQQAYRISVGDVSLQITNRRFAYNFEDARLSRGQMVLSEADRDDAASMRGLSSPLRRMQLITLLSLDSVNASIVKRKSIQKANESRITASLGFGSLNIYGCKDSFDCFTNTVGELNLKLTGLTADQLREMRKKQEEQKSSDESTETTPSSSTADNFFDSRSDDEELFEDSIEGHSSPRSRKKREALQVLRASSDDFQLDGYDWTTVDHQFSKDGGIPSGEDHVAKWYGTENDRKPPMLDIVHDELSAIDAPGTKRQILNIIPQHIGPHQSGDPLALGDMDAQRHANTKDPLAVKTRVLLRDLKVRCRFFDGYDWPQEIAEMETPKLRKYAFIIDEAADRNAAEVEKAKEQAGSLKQSRKSALMGDLLGEDDPNQGTFKDIPLAEERGKLIRNTAEERRLARRMNRFLQISVQGVVLRMDSFEDRTDHRLASCMDLKVSDLFLAETISSDRPVKLLGEWLNEVEHPRDSGDGLLMLKMVTWKPVERINETLELLKEESQAVLHILPLRCYIDQRALRFARAFFAKDQAKDEDGCPRWGEDLTEIPPPLFQKFKVKPCKMKVDYSPEKVDVSALRDGAIVELVNISPINDMVIILKAVEMEQKDGFGACMGQLVSSWIRDIVDTQVYKFVTNSSPFQPLTGISGGVADMIILPWDAIQNGEDVKKAIKSGVKSAVGSFAYETLNATAKLTNMAAQQLASRRTLNGGGLPTRPTVMPRGFADTAGHAVNSIAKGVEAANYKVVIVPYRRLQSHGPASAAKSIVEGIPVAVMAPLGAASEAISYSLLGARNLVRPDIRREEEASQRGLNYREL